MKNLETKFLLIDKDNNDTIETPKMYLFDLINQMYGDRDNFNLELSYKIMLSAYNIYFSKDNNFIKLD